MLIRDLSTGGVIRQQKVIDFNNKLKSVTIPGIKERNVKDTAFDDTKPYELTALGKQFVHYTMQDTILKLANNNS